MQALYARPQYTKSIAKWTWHADQVVLPVLEDGCVLIRVHAAGLRRADLSDSHFYKRLADRDAPLPQVYVPGTDVSGVVTGVSGDVNGLSIGDEVMAFVSGDRGGGCAEQVAAPADAVWKKPASLCHAEASALGTDGLTAFQAIEEAAPYLPANTRPEVLITGAAAGSGTLITQLAKSLHKAKITVVYRHESALNVLNKLHVDRIVHLASGESILRKIDPASFDVAFDTAGIAVKISSLVKAGGAIISTDGTPPRDALAKHLKLPREVEQEMKLRQERLDDACEAADISMHYVFPSYNSHRMQKIVALAESNAIRTAYGPIYGIDNFQLAVNATEKQLVGKVILLMQQPENTTPRTKNLLASGLIFG